MSSQRGLRTFTMQKLVPSCYVLQELGALTSPGVTTPQPMVLLLMLYQGIVTTVWSGMIYVATVILGMHLLSFMLLYAQYCMYKILEG